MAELSVAGHVLKGLAKGAGRVILAFFVAGIVVAALTEGLHYVLTGGRNGLYTHIGAIALGVGWGLAVALLVLVIEVGRVAFEAARAAATQVEKGAGEVGSMVGGAIQGIEGKVEHK